MQAAQARILADGRRLHLHHGPIDLIIEAWGSGRVAAYARVQERFETVLEELADELTDLRKVSAGKLAGKSPICSRMFKAVAPFGERLFVTPMAAVAGAVADEMLRVIGTDDINKAYVNNGGDIALYLAPEQRFDAAMPGGAISLGVLDGIGGIATSGWGGRSYSLGIADSVTVLAKTAAQADVAATLIANAVDVANPDIRRVPANEVSPDSDLGGRLITRYVPPLSPPEKADALHRGVERATEFQRRGLIAGAALTLQGQTRTVALTTTKDLNHA